MKFQNYFTCLLSPPLLYKSFFPETFKSVIILLQQQQLSIISLFDLFTYDGPFLLFFLYITFYTCRSRLYITHGKIILSILPGTYNWKVLSIIRAGQSYSWQQSSLNEGILRQSLFSRPTMAHCSGSVIVMNSRFSAHFKCLHFCLTVITFLGMKRYNGNFPFAL